MSGDEQDLDQLCACLVHRLPDLVQRGNQLFLQAFDGVAGDCVDASGFGWVPIELGKGQSSR